MDRGVIVGSGDLLNELQLGAGFGNVDQGTDDVGLCILLEATLCANKIKYNEKIVPPEQPSTSCAHRYLGNISPVDVSTLFVDRPTGIGSVADYIESQS